MSLQNNAGNQLSAFSSQFIEKADLHTKGQSIACQMPAKLKMKRLSRGLIADG
jgi:hypothetical protein